MFHFQLLRSYFFVVLCLFIVILSLFAFFGLILVLQLSSIRMLRLHISGQMIRSFTGNRFSIENLLNRLLAYPHYVE